MIPKIAKWILSRSLRSYYNDTVLGDLEEEFEYIAENEGENKAKFWYWKQAVKSIPHFIKNTFTWGAVMFKNYITVALRNIRNNKIYSIINIAGIAISLAACFLILQYISFEQSYDQFHENKSTLYRLTNDRYQNGQLIQHGVITYPSVAKTIKQDFPEVKNYSRLISYSRMYVKKENIAFEETFLFADSAFFEMFSFDLIKGTKESVLGNPYSIVISETNAEKYFGRDWASKNIIGEVVNVDNDYDLTITGVLNDVPANSHMIFDFVVSYSTLGKQYNNNYEDSWRNSNFMSYLQLNKDSKPEVLEAKFIDFSRQYFDGEKVTGYVEEFFLQPLTDIHLLSDYEYETWAHGSNTTVIGLLLIAGFIMIITWVNFINLSASRSVERAKEVGVRKVIGAQRFQIIKQFLTESLLMNLFGTAVAIVIVISIESVLSDLLGIYFSSTVFSSEIGLLFLTVFLFGTVISGFYPAILASSYKSLSVLTGKFKNSTRGRIIRKGLVVFQFALSFILIAGTYSVFNQINFMMNQDLGMNINQILVVNGPVQTARDSLLQGKMEVFKEGVNNLASVSKIGTAQRLLGRGTGKIFNIQKEGIDSDKKYTTLDVSVDYTFFETFEMEIVSGRNFDYSDHNFSGKEIYSVVINETALKELGYSSADNAIGEKLKFWGANWEIKGVVEDYHHQSLHKKVEPIIFTPRYSNGSYSYIKIGGGDVHGTIADIEKLYAEIFPGNSFTYFFLDEFYNQQYEADKRFRSAFTIFASLGVLLSCLGLFGLSFFTTVQRSKEIGVRKVIGATTADIIVLLLKGFTLLIIIASILAAPLAYFFINQWLQNYAYSIDFGWIMLIIPMIIVVAVGIITVGYQSIKAALTNPVDSIKYE